MVGGDHCCASDLAKVPGDGNRQRSSFFRISSGTKLIEQDERIRGYRSRNGINPADVGGKCREILFDGLVIPDIRKHSVEYRKLGPVGGNRNAGLRHQRQQSQSLERDSLASGVRSGDDELSLVLFQLDACRHDRSTFCSQVPFEKWMASFLQNRPGV